MTKITTRGAGADCANSQLGLPKDSTVIVRPQNRSLGVVPAIKPAAPWRVRRVEVRPNFELTVDFNDGLSGTVKMRNLVHSLDAGVFGRLSDPDFFAQVRIELGAVTWPGGLDLAPDAMYDAIAQSGEFVPA